MDYMANAIKKILAISRPKMWVYPAGAYIIGFTVSSYHWVYLTSAAFWLHVFFFSIVAGIFIHGIAAFFDKPASSHTTKQKLENKARVEPLEEPSEHWLIPVLLAVLALGAIFLFLQPNYLSAALFVAFLFLGYAYSAPPFRLKDRPLLDIFSTLLFILPGIIGYTQNAHELPEPFMIAAAWFWIAGTVLFSSLGETSPIAYSPELADASTTKVYGKRVSLYIAAIVLGIAALLVILSWQFFPFTLITLVFPVFPLWFLQRAKSETQVGAWIMFYMNAALLFAICGTVIFQLVF